MIVNDDVEIDGPVFEDAFGLYRLDPDLRTSFTHFGAEVKRKIPNAAGVFLNVSLLDSAVARLGVGRKAPQDPEGGYFSFSFVLIGRDVWEEVGGFEEKMPFTFEDAAFSDAARRAGMPVTSAGRAGVTHLHSLTTTSNIRSVLPVSSWSAYQYLLYRGVSTGRAKTMVVAALCIRVCLAPLNRANFRDQFSGIVRAMAHIVSGRVPALPAFDATSRSRGLRVSASGLMPTQTGIGVVQRELYPRLARRFEDFRTSSSRAAGSGTGQRLRGLIRGARSGGLRADVLLVVVPPFPLTVKRTTRVVTIVHDLRWRRTRGFIGRTYRWLDLRRTVKRSDALICISEATKQELLEVFPDAGPKVQVHYLGPGIPDRETSRGVLRRPGAVLLVGGAAHKRNEFAARILIQERPSWCTKVVGVGLSDECVSSLRRSSLDFEEHRGVSDEELVSIYRSAEVLLFLGVDEGFGMPLIEAMRFGCQVVAADTHLHRSLLGDVGLYVEGFDKTAADMHRIDRQSFASADQLLMRSSLYSWEKFTDGVVGAISESKNLPHD